MKVKELIKELQALDPTGELYVSGLYAVDRLRGYYDGAGLQVRLDEDVIEYNDIEDKIVFYTMDVMQALDQGIDIRVNVRDSRKQLYEDYIRTEKEKLEKIYKEIEAGNVK